MDKFPNLVKMKKIKERSVPDISTSELLELTSEIVSAHVGASHIVSSDLPRLIEEVYETLENLAMKGISNE